MKCCLQCGSYLAEPNGIAKALGAPPMCPNGYCGEPGGPRFDQYGNRVNEDGTLWNLDGKLAARNGNE